MADRLFNGSTYERLAEKYDLSTQQVKNIVYKAIDGRKADKVWKLMDELVEAVKILHPRMYTTFIDKVQDL